MPQIVLDGPQVMPLVRQRVSAGVAAHVRMNAAQLGTLADEADEVVNALARERPIPFGDE